MLRQNFFLPRQQLEQLLKSVGVVIEGGTSTDLICYCPFHSNKDSPALNISLSAGHLWKCWSGKCGLKGNLITLLKMKGYSYSEAMKMVKHGEIAIDDLVALLQEIFHEDSGEEEDDSWVGIDPQNFALSDEANNFPARTYLSSRGITEEAYGFFQMGYSAPKKMVVIPVFKNKGELCGVIGRSIAVKRYQYSTGMTRGTLVWNLNHAKAYDSVILTEGALDAVYIWQSGHRNVAAVLGSAVSPRQLDLIKTYFTEVICFFDNDDAGDGATNQLLNQLTDVLVSYVEYPTRMIECEAEDGSTTYRKIKDPGELTIEEINNMISTRKTSIDLLLSGD